MHLTVKGSIEPRHKMVIPGESGVICVLREDADDFSLEIVPDRVPGGDQVRCGGLCGAFPVDECTEMTLFRPVRKPQEYRAWIR